MVMVGAGDVFGQLEPGMVGGGDDAMHHPGVFEHGEIAVGRALRQGRLALEQFGDGHRRRGSGEGGDDGLSIGGVPLIEHAETGHGDLMDLAQVEAGGWVSEHD